MLVNVHIHVSKNPHAFAHEDFWQAYEAFGAVEAI